MHLCTQNARGTVVATEAATFQSWNVVGTGRLLHLLFCVFCLFSCSGSFSLTLCADVRCVRDLQGLRGPSLWCCSTRKLWIPLLVEASPWQSCSSTCSCSWLDPSFLGRFSGACTLGISEQNLLNFREQQRKDRLSLSSVAYSGLLLWRRIGGKKQSRITRRAKPVSGGKRKEGGMLESEER